MNYNNGNEFFSTNLWIKLIGMVPLHRYFKDAWESITLKIIHTFVRLFYNDDF